jgi:transposase
MPHSLADYDLVSESIQGSNIGILKRVQRTPEEKRRIVEATLVPGASIARVARENGVNANQVFQWRYEYRKGAAWAKQSRPELLPVTIAPDPKIVTVAKVVLDAPASFSTGSIHIELAGRASVSIEGSVDAELVRAVLGSILR